MNYLNKITIRNLKLNKKRTIVTVIGIVLSVSLIVCILSMLSSAKESIIEYEKVQKGNYHYLFREVTQDNLKYITNNRNVESYYIIETIGYANIENNKSNYKPYAYIASFDDESLKNLELIEGRFPENDSEIVIPSHLKSNGRIYYEIGDTITLDIGTRKDLQDENRVLTQDDPHFAQNDKEILINTKKHTYKIVGIIKKPTLGIEPSYAPGFTFVTKKNLDNESNLNVYVRYKDLKKEETTTSEILGLDKELHEFYYDNKVPESQEEALELSQRYDSQKRFNFSMNYTLVYLESADYKENTMQKLYMIVLLVITLIVIVSVFCIKNSFDISVSERVKDISMLKSIGATKRQIKKSIYFEGCILSLISIPIGLFLGIFGTKLLLSLCNLLSIVNVHFIFKVSYISIVLSVLISLLTIFFSLQKGIKTSNKITLISGIRESEKIKLKASKCPKIISRIWKIGGEISYKNIKRNKIKLIPTIISIISCVSIFIVSSSFVFQIFSILNTNYKTINFNIELHPTYYYDEPAENYNESKEFLLSVEDYEGVEKFTILRNKNFFISSPQYTEKYTKIYPDIAKRDFSEDDLYQEQTSDHPISVLALGNREYKRYIKELGLNYDEIKDKGILINETNEVFRDLTSISKSTINTEIFSYQVNDKITGYNKLYNSDTDIIKIPYEFTIGYITNKLPTGNITLQNNMGSLIVSDEYYNKFNSKIKEKSKSKIDSYIIYAYVNPSDIDEFQNKIEENVNSDEINFINYNSDKKEQESRYIMASVFLFGFIFIIAIIGLTNIINTITSSMNLRIREFASLKSIGMTSKEFNNMIFLESFFYGIFSLIVAIPLGISFSLIIHKAMNDYYLDLPLIGHVEYPYELPIIPIFLSIVIVLILICFLNRYSLKIINKKNIIDTLRNENI